MDFGTKLQELRKGRGLTQEELAAALYVSRTAVSKWESGRGYPNIDSLKAVATFFSVSVDALLSGEQLLTMAEEDSRRKITRLQDVVYGLLDLSTALLLFLPFFGDTVNGVLRAVYVLAVLVMVAFGILTLVLQGCRRAFWLRYKHSLSLTFGLLGVLLFILSPQPYAAALLLVFTTIKAMMRIKQR